MGSYPRHPPPLQQETCTILSLERSRCAWGRYEAQDQALRRMEAACRSNETQLEYMLHNRTSMYPPNQEEMMANAERLQAETHAFKSGIADIKARVRAGPSCLLRALLVAEAWQCTLIVRRRRPGARQ